MLAIWVLGLSIASLLLFSMLAYSETYSSSSDKYVDVLIGYNGEPDMSEVMAMGADIKYDFESIDVLAARIPQNAVTALAVDPDIAFIEPDAKVYAVGHTSSIPEYQNSWSVDHIEADKVHANGNKGTAIKICILDTGMDYNHPDLAANFKGGKDFVNNDDDPMDDDFFSHGTHVAGIAAAVLNGAGVVGVAPEAYLYIGKVLDRFGTGSISNVIAGIEWCVDNNANIISMSLGSSTGSVAWESALNAAYNNGVLLVAAAGNGGNCEGTGDNVRFPARYDSVIAVVATRSDDTRACFSSTGPAVELSAPGVNIISTILNGFYSASTGTSFATPHVSGSAALVWNSDETAWVRDGYTNGDGVWTNVEVRTVLDKTAQDLGPTGRDQQYGYGLVRPDFYASHSFSATINPQTVQPGTNSAFTVTLVNTAKSESHKRLGSFTVDIPTSFTSLGKPTVSAPPGTHWTCSLSGSTIKCHAVNSTDRLFDGQSLFVSISAKPTLAGVFQWTVNAYHLRSFADPIRLSGLQPQVTVNGPGSITIVKNTVPDDATAFSFTSNTLSPNNFQLDDDGDNNGLSNTQTFSNLLPGIYDVAETPNTAYLTSAKCSDGSPVNAIVLSPGESVTCTFTNAKKSSITIVKDALPDDPQDFTYTTIGNGMSNFQLDDDGDNTNGLSNERTFGSLAAGTYTVTENLPAGWVLGINCVTAGGTTFNVVGNSVSITLTAAGTAECTFTNTKLGSITIVKDTVPDDGTAFSFTSNTLSPNNFQLDDDGDNNGLSNTRTFSNLVPNTYDLTETLNSAYQTSAVCSDASPVNAIDLNPGENITCTFTNIKLSSITIIKDAQPDDPQDFKFTAMFVEDDNFFLDDDGDNTNELSNEQTFSLVPDTYTVTENEPDGWELADISCETTGSTTFSVVGNTVSITLTADGTAECTFINFQPPTGGSDRSIFHGRGFAFGDPNSASYDDIVPTFGNVLTQSGSLKVIAEIRDNVGVKDAKLLVGATSYPMTPYNGNPLFWIGIVPSSDLLGGTVQFKIVARDYNNNVAEYEGSAEVPAGTSSTSSSASFAVRPLTADQPAAYSITATGIRPSDTLGGTDQNSNPQITIKNTGTETLQNVRLMLSPELKGKFLLSDYAIKSIAPNSEFTVSLKLNGKPNVDVMNNPIPYNGKVIISVDNHSPYILELSGNIPNESATLQSLFMKTVVSKGEQRYKSFEKPEERISQAEYDVKLGSGETVIKSASDELIISNTSDKPLKNLRIMTSSLGDHFILDQKNIELLPAGSFVKVKLVSKMNNAESPRDLSGEIIIAPENGTPVTILISIGKQLAQDRNAMYEIHTVSGDAVSNTADSIVIKNNSGESIDNVRIILPRELARVFSLSEDSFKSIEPDSEVTVSIKQRGTLDSNVKQMLNDYTGDIIIVSSDGMKKIVPVDIVWKGISSEHFVVNARDDAEEMTKATQVINFLERNYGETTKIVGETNTKTVIYMTSSLDELKMLGDALAPSAFIYNEDVALVWSNSEDVNILALKEFAHRTIMHNYGSYWAKQKISADKGNWLVDGISNYATGKIVGERGMIKSQLDAFTEEPATSASTAQAQAEAVPFEWYGSSTPSQHGASYTLFKFIADRYGDTIIDKILNNLGSTTMSNRCDTVEQCALVRAVYDANGFNMNDKRHDISFDSIVQEWKQYVQDEYGISNELRN